MDSFEFPQPIQQIAHDVMQWTGYGVLAGLLAKAILPGRDPGGTLATLATGILGGLMGCGILTYFIPNQQIHLLTPAGFGVSVAGSLTLLGMYRLLSGRTFREGDGDRAVVVREPMFRRYTRRRSVLRELED